MQTLIRSRVDEIQLADTLPLADAEVRRARMPQAGSVSGIRRMTRGPEVGVRDAACTESAIEWHSYNCFVLAACSQGKVMPHSTDIHYL